MQTTTFENCDSKTKIIVFSGGLILLNLFLLFISVGEEEPFFVSFLW